MQRVQSGSGLVKTRVWNAAKSPSQSTLTCCDAKSQNPTMNAPSDEVLPSLSPTNAFYIP